jgi:hypothetical protein
MQIAALQQTPCANCPLMVCVVYYILMYVLARVGIASRIAGGVWRGSWKNGRWPAEDPALVLESCKNQKDRSSAISCVGPNEGGKI